MTSIRLSSMDRKAVAQRLAEITGEASRYTRLPRCAYEVGSFIIERDGTVTVSDRADLEPLRTLAAEGLLEPFDEAPEPQAKETGNAPTAPDSAPAAANDGLTITLLMDGFSPEAIDRLEKLVGSKAALITKALGADRLTIERDADRVCFPWWSRSTAPEEIQAYTNFISALWRMAENAQRVTAKETDVECEKYAFRCFLIRLGFSGVECKEQRKVLMRRLSGSAAFPTKEKADAFSAVQKAKRDTSKAAESEVSESCG